jgi:dTDP-4-dehydrorhamnose 3,5-epimerase
LSRFTVSALPLAGLKLVRRQRLGDGRGFLSRLFCTGEFAALGIPLPVAQINHTLTLRRGTVRGMHFQRPPHTEAKLVTCVRGEVWDVAVDLRSGSATQLQWHAQVLSAENLDALLVPQGFAHGFQALTDNCELIYLHSAPFVPEAEGGLRPTDPALAIRWPLEVVELSARDGSHPLVAAGFQGILT